MMIAALWLTGWVLCMALFRRQQGILQTRLAVAHEGVQELCLRAVAWNGFILLVPYSVLYALVGAHGVVVQLLLIGALYLLNEGLINYFGRVVTKGDLSSFREALTFLPSLVRHTRYALKAAGLGLCLAVAFAAAAALNGLVDFYHPQLLQLRIHVALGAALACLLLVHKAMRWPVVGDALAASWTDQNANVRRLGFLLQFLLVLAGLRRTPKPPSIDGHVDRLLRIQQNVTADASDVPCRPDVIFLMMESLADLPAMGIPLAVDPLARFKRPCDGKVSGHLRVHVIGGNTCDTEFEVLTGIAVSDRGVATQPFMGSMNARVYSMAHAFRRHGYRATAVHPFHRWFYNRDRVYGRLGIQEFLADESFVGAERLFGKVSDEAFVDKVMASLTSDAPHFLFGVSILGHGPYGGAHPPERGYLAQGGIDDAQLRSAIDHYCGLMERADAAVERLHQALIARDKPFVLVVFGDHVPVFSDDLRGQERWDDIFCMTGAVDLPDHVLHRTPLAVFSNVSKVSSKSLGEIDASDLAAEVMARIGLSDPCAFGALRTARLDDALAGAYAYDTVHGKQRATARFLVQGDLSVERTVRDRYRTFAVEKQKIALLSEAIRQGDLASADALYAQFAPSDVLFGDASQLWALMRVRHGVDDAGVRKALEAAAERATDPFYALYHRIDWEVSLGFLDAVRQAVARAVRISPGRVYEMCAMAQELFSQGNLPACEAILDVVADLNADLGTEKVLWASLKLDAGRTDRQVEQTLVAATSDPDPFWAHYHCVRLFASRGDVGSVSSHASRALCEYPAMASTLVELARDLFAGNRGAAALAVLDPMAQMPVDWRGGHVLWAALRIDAGRMDEQVEVVLRQSFADATGDFWACYHCVRLYGRQNNLTGIAEAVVVALDRYPDMVAHLLALAMDEFQDQRAACALAMLDPIAARGVELGAAKTLWAALRIDAGRIDAAVEHTLERACNEPDPFWAWYHRLRLHGVQGNLPAMHTCKEEALRLQPERLAELEHLMAQFQR